MITIGYTNNKKSLEKHMKTTTVAENTKDRLRSIIKLEITGGDKKSVPNYGSNINSNSSSINQAKAEKKRIFLPLI